MRRTSLSVAVLAGLALATAPTVASAATWSLQTTVDPGSAISSSLAGTACPGLRSCLAVGRWDDGSGAPQAQAQSWDGSTWTAQTPATPSGAVATELQGIACTATNACTAVGSFDDGSGVTRTLVQRWTGSWAVQSSPHPTGALGSFLSGVSCASSSECTAVGASIDAGGVQQPLVLEWSGGTWTQQSAPLPAGATTGQLSGVSCASGSACVAVGSFTDATGQKPLALAWNGSSWSAMTAANPSGVTGAGLSGVSCTSSTACTAVGSSNSSGVYSPLVERLSGTTWTEQTAAIPSGATGAALTGVSCTSGTHCSAAGYSYDAGGTFSSLAELWSASTWAVETTPGPRTAAGTLLSGISCRSSTECTAAGQWFDAGFNVETLALRYS